MILTGQNQHSNSKCMRAKLLQLCLILCNPRDCDPPDSSAFGILQARIWEWVAVPFSRDLLNPGLKPMSLMSPELAGDFFTTSATWETQFKIISINKDLRSLVFRICSACDI